MGDLRAHRVAQAALAAGAALLLAGCSSSGPAPAPSSVPSSGPATPLPTKGAHVNLLCGFVSRAAVETALGRTGLSAQGGVDRAGGDPADLTGASCTVRLPGTPTTQAADLTIRVEPVAVTDLDIVTNARRGTAAVTLPPDLGVGFVDRDRFTDHAGRVHDTAGGGLIRGDWTVTAAIASPAAGRDPAADVVALVQEVVDTLGLRSAPSRPYPAPFYSADPSLATPSPR